MHRITPLLLFLAAGCDIAPDTTPDTDLGAGIDLGSEQDASGPPRDATPSADTALPATDRFVVGAAQGSYAVPFTITIDGDGTGRVGDVAITGGSGTVVIDGATLPLGVYERQAWDAFGYTLFQALAVAPDQLSVLWFYCRDGALTDVWIETANGPPMAHHPASGTCTESSSPSAVEVDFPALDMPHPMLVDGFELAGPNVEIVGAQPGSLRVASDEYEVYVFGLVDCTMECGDAGWYELHALLWDGRRQALSFAIFYLFLDDRDPLLAYAFSLPSLSAPFPTTTLSGASWSGP